MTGDSRERERGMVVDPGPRRGGDLLGDAGAEEATPIHAEVAINADESLFRLES